MHETRVSLKKRVIETLFTELIAESRRDDSQHFEAEVTSVVPILGQEAKGKRFTCEDQVASSQRHDVSSNVELRLLSESSESGEVLDVYEGQH